MKKLILISVVLIFFIFLVLPVTGISVEQYFLNRSYVTSSQAKWCYVAGHENKNLKNKIYYKSAGDCPNPLKLK